MRTISNFELLSHISPIGLDNVLLYGEYQLKPQSRAKRKA